MRLRGLELNDNALRRVAEASIHHSE